MDAPKEWLGSLPEYLVYLAIGKLGFKEHEDFIYYPNGMGIDFYFPLLVLAINIESGTMDVIRRAQLQSTGIRMAYIQEAEALQNATYYVKRALKGG